MSVLDSVSLRHHFLEKSIASAAIVSLLVSTPCGAQVGAQFSTEFANTASISKTQSVPKFPKHSSPKVLQAGISRFAPSDLEIFHKNFKLKAAKSKSNIFVDGEAFNDFIKRNNFLANAFLIQLSPPSIENGRESFNNDQVQLEQAHTMLAKYEDLRARAELSLKKLDANEKEVNQKLEWLTKSKLPSAQAKVVDLNNQLAAATTDKERTDLAAEIEIAQEAVDRLLLIQANYLAELDSLKLSRPSALIDQTITRALVQSTMLWIAECQRDMHSGSKDLEEANHPDPARLPAVNGLTKYLLVLNYNLPAVRPFGFAVNYRFARFCGQVLLRRGEGTDPLQPTPIDFDDKFSYLNVPIISCYPQNKTATADLTNTSKWELQAQPQWSGFSAGSITYTNETDINQKLILPRIVGMNTGNGAVQWTYYPAKWQQIGFGSQTAYAVINVANGKPDDVLQMDLALDYEYKSFKIPLGTNHEYQSIHCRLSDALYTAPQIDNFRRLYLRDLCTEDQLQIERLLALKDPMMSLKPPDDNNDPPASKVSSKDPSPSAKTPAPKAKPTKKPSSKPTKSK